MRGKGINGRAAAIPFRGRPPSDTLGEEVAVRSFLFRRGFILPVTVTGVIPLAITLATGAWRGAFLASILAGAPLYAAGLSMLILTTGLFDRHHGSLAPWNPPTELVVTGPYRYCRNPMITGIYATFGVPLPVQSDSQHEQTQQEDYLWGV